MYAIILTALYVPEPNSSREIFFSSQFTYRSGQAVETTPATGSGIGSTGSTVFYSPPSFAPAPSPLTVQQQQQQQRSLRLPNQSPAPAEEERVRYRTPPNAPFQPPFYRTPSEAPDRALNPQYRLPGGASPGLRRRQVRTSTERWMSAEKEEQRKFEQLR